MDGECFYIFTPTLTLPPITVEGTICNKIKFP